MATIGSVKKPGTYERVKVVSGVVSSGGGGIYTSSGSNISAGEIPEEQAKQILQKEIEARQRGEEGTRVDGGFLSYYEEKPTMTTTYNPATKTTLPTQQAKQQEQLQKIRSDEANIPVWARGNPNAPSWTRNPRQPMSYQKNYSSGEITPGTTGTSRGGLIFLNEKDTQEARSINPTLPIWTPVSENTPRGMVEAVTEAKYAGNVRVSNTGTATGLSLSGGMTLSKGQFESNQAQIKFAQEEFKFARDTRQDFIANPTAYRNQPGFEEVTTEEGTYYTLGSEYFKQTNRPGYDDFRKEARDDFYKMNFFQRTASSLGDLEIGSRQLGLGFAEFTRDVGATIYGSFAFKQIKPGDLSGFKEIKTRFTTQQLPGKQTMATPVSQPLTNPRNFWKFTGETLTETPGYVMQSTGYALGAYYAGSLSVGSFTGTISQLQPLRISGGIRVPDLRREFKYDLKESGTLEFKKGKTSTKVTGASTKDLGIELVSYQTDVVSGGRLTGTSTTIINTPYSYVTPSGYLQVLGGRANIYQVSGYTGTPQGLGTNIQGATYYTSSLGSGYNYFNNVGYSQTTATSGAISSFRYVTGNPVTSFVRSGNTYYTQSSFDPGFYGTGLRIDLGYKPSGTGYTQFRGGGGSSGGGSNTFSFGDFSGGSTTTFQTPQPTPAVSTSFQSPVVIGSTTPTFATSSLTFKTPTFATGLRTRQESPTIISPTIDTFQATKTETDAYSGFVGDNFFNPTKSSTRSSQNFITTTTTAQTTAQTTEQTSIGALGVVTPIITIPNLRIRKDYIGIGGLPLGFGGLGSPGTRKYKGRRRFRYTPSYEAFIFNIRGSKPKGIETGARIRPITPSFSFFRRFNKGIRGFGSIGDFKFNNPFQSSKRRRKKKR